MLYEQQPKKTIQENLSNPSSDAGEDFLSNDLGLKMQGPLKQELLAKFKKRCRLLQCSAAPGAAVVGASWFQEGCIDLIFLTDEEGQSRGVAKSY